MLGCKLDRVNPHAFVMICDFDRLFFGKRKRQSIRRLAVERANWTGIVAILPHFHENEPSIRQRHFHFKESGFHFAPPFVDRDSIVAKILTSCNNYFDFVSRSMRSISALPATVTSKCAHSSNPRFAQSSRVWYGVLVSLQSKSSSTVALNSASSSGRSFRSPNVGALCGEK